MKAPRITLHSGLAMLAGLVLSTTGAGAGQVVISNFDVDTDATAWSWESWSDPASVSFDTLNAGGGAPGSGSLRVVNDFPDRPAGYGQAVVTLALGSSIDAPLPTQMHIFQRNSACATLKTVCGSAQ